MNQSVEEAAVIDGCTKFSAFWRVTFPLLKPITATVVIMQASVFGIITPRRCSFCRIKITIRSFGDFHVFSNLRRGLYLLAAGAIIGLAPVVLVFILFQKQFVKGLSSGAVKG